MVKKERSIKEDSMSCCKRLLVIVSVAVICAAGQAGAKSLLEKSIYFVNPTSGKTDSCKYWKLYIGTFQSVTLVRKFPGEDSLPVNSDLNLTVLSSGYIEGYGYTRKGRVDCMASFVVDTGAGAIKLPVDSIEYVTAGGAKVKPRGMRLCDCALDVEGNKLPGIRKLLLTKYKLVMDADERNLKPLGDMDITFFAFSRAALAAAQKADKEAAASAK
jgi:hypothetical protein